MYSTPCFPAGAGPDYVNACVSLDYDGSAESLLQILHSVESDFGRARVQRWGSRSLDLDLIAAGDRIVPTTAEQKLWLDLPLQEQKLRAPDELILPHPRMQERAFVLVPLLDIAPDWVHPVLGRSVWEMFQSLPQDMRDEVVPL